MRGRIPATGPWRKFARTAWSRLADAGRALHGFLRGFTGLASAPPATRAAARRALEEAAARRPRCC
jgi:hypothetical protein